MKSVFEFKQLSLPHFITSTSIHERLQYIQKMIPSSVDLLVVSKGNSTEKIRQIAMLNQRHFGENKVQEAIVKQKLLKDCMSLNWHFIGRIQSNKIRKIVINFTVIHSVSNIFLAKELQRIAIEERRSPKILLQLKLLNDSNKVGFNARELLESWHILAALKPLNLIGLMIIAPLDISICERRKLFSESRKLIQLLDLQKFSIGMSNDWREAIVEGGNCIRIGSILFNDKH